MLALLDRGPAHGYELKRAHDELFGDVAPPVNVGQIYVTLTRLERDGSVVHHVEANADGPDRKIYELTEVGRKALRGWLADPSELPVGKSDIVLKLVAGLITDGTIAPAVAEHRMRCIQALRTLADLRAAKHPAGKPRGPGGLNEAANTNDTSTGANGTGGRTDLPVGLGDLLREASVLHLQAELRWLDLVEERLSGRL
ncbi:PadR family transcriptional regulator [Frankia sp. CcI49]|uniref:PadR family transcriptional regulator n=1 Tax=unclassified Frankia TaxID=2632575 RepID=UPI0006CA4AC7|nr:MULTISPECIES: PadR family transcriptional regulator [unclassified Frankia]KPM53533.1 PadR family transcriptional regulator [Frankia sp. R43]ONH54907.1 PadR family transcriptional regulator [Frankia sp. CcI49]